MLTLHSDRGAPMTSKCTAQLLADLGVTRSLSRPQVSDDNPFLRGAVQDPEVSPRLPWPLRRHYRRHRLLPVVLPLVQHRTSPWRDRHAHPGRRASQSNPERAGAARADPSSRLDPSSRTLRSRDPTTGSPSPSRLDQPTCDTHNRRNCSVNRNRHCLKVVDRSGDCVDIGEKSVGNFLGYVSCEVPREMGIEGGGLGRTVVGEPTDHRQSVAEGKSTRSEGNAVRCGRDEMGSGGCSASVRL